MRRPLLLLAIVILLSATLNGEPRIDPNFGTSGGYSKNPNGSDRALQIPSPEQLDAAADFIITGEVMAVQDSMKTNVASYQDPSPPAPPEHIMHAFVKVLNAFKGMTDEDQIDFRYPVTAPNYQSSNSPNHVVLVKNRRYRFFLKKDDSGSGYIGALDGKIDDEYAVEAMGPDEADDHPYLKTKDALALARACYAGINPQPNTDVRMISGDCSDPFYEGGARWFVDFWPSDMKQPPVAIAIVEGKASLYNPQTDPYR